MEKVVVKSRVYNNHKIMLNGGPVQFVGGRAEVSEELYQETLTFRHTRAPFLQNPLLF